MKTVLFAKATYTYALNQNYATVHVVATFST